VRSIKRVGNKVVKFLLNSKSLSFPREIGGKLLNYIVEQKYGAIMYFDDPKRKKIASLINRIKDETEMLLTMGEAYQLFMAAKNTSKVDGDLAEVGVYKGGSAKLICEAKGDRVLHLFDTFKGIPDVDGIDSNKFHEGQFAASLEEVKNYLKGYQNVFFYKGVFPRTSAPVVKKKFSFVHLDVDTYKSTLDCLKFFYPRMTRGSIMISHDYISARGVRKAFDIFFRDKPEVVLEMFGSQCFVVKL